MKNNGFICYCNNATEKECLRNYLFGHKELVNHIKDANNLSPLGYLYNYKKDMLIGPFRATSDFKMNIDRIAFKGRYPFQIEVESDGPTYRKNDALKFFREIGIQIITTQLKHKLPFPVISGNQVEKLKNWLNSEDDNFSPVTDAKITRVNDSKIPRPVQPELFSNEVNISTPLSDLIDEMINSPLSLFMHPFCLNNLNLLKNRLQNRSSLSLEEADDFLVYLRENIIKIEFEDYQAESGLLRKKIRNHLLTKKIKSQEDFDQIRDLKHFEFDKRQIKYLPLIFEITKLIKP